MLSIEDRIRIFAEIRDIPYTLPLTPAEVEDSKSCYGKSLKLARLLEEGGLQTRQRICTFSWVDSRVPPDVLDVCRMPGDANDYHQYIDVLIPETEEWVSVDPTWDKPLTHGPFRLIEWDGLSATPIAVRVKETLSPEKSAEFIHAFQVNTIGTKVYLEEHQEFLKAFNNWLEEVRSRH